VPRIRGKGRGRRDRSPEGFLEDAPKVGVDQFRVGLAEQAHRLVEGGCCVGELERELALTRDLDGRGVGGSVGIELNQQGELEVGPAEEPLGR
jgi:hypothetical protein